MLVVSCRAPQRFVEEGNQLVGAAPGDVVFIVEEQPSQGLFHRHGNNLHMTMAVSLQQALLGFNVQYRHMDGHAFRVENTGVTRPGTCAACLYIYIYPYICVRV